MLTLPPGVECVCLSVCLEGHSFMFLFVFSSCLVASLSDECSRRLVLSGVSDLVFDGSASALGLLGLSSRPNPMPPGPPCALPSAWNALPCLVPHGLLPILHSLLRSCPHGKAPPSPQVSPVSQASSLWSSRLPHYPFYYPCLSRPRNTDSEHRGRISPCTAPRSCVFTAAWRRPESPVRPRKHLLPLLSPQPQGQKSRGAHPSCAEVHGDVPKRER